MLARHFLRVVLFLGFGLGSDALIAAHADYVGSAECAPCHQQQAADWAASHHDLAMQEASADAVLGDFDDQVFEHFGVATRFFRANGKFMVRTDGPDGKLHDYPVKYTFGVFPLQQYLIEFPGGRLQVLDIAWDSRPQQDGGQRWMHLHPQDAVPHDDVLHWSGPNLNWNYMCADCHSTQLKKNYDAATDRYRTEWSEINVACEACHGPGANHLAWAEADKKGLASSLPNRGLSLLFDERDGVSWQANAQTGQIERSQPRRSHKEIDVCARCHSRRSQLSDEVSVEKPFMDAFRPSLLSPGLYYPDGQMEDEVYVWGSFLQSKMHQAGVTCSDCHDPHKADLKAPGEMVCYQCHAADRYASPKHHFHPVASAGASCVECHMPATEYMRVDARHDHSMRIPRPDLSVEMGAPNACNRCHQDKSAAWAAQQMTAWYGEPPSASPTYATVLRAARQRLPEAAGALQALAADGSAPGIVRATALSHLGDYPQRASLQALQQGLQDKDPLLRMAALGALDTYAQQQRILAFPLLWDEIKAVRIEAARLLAPFPPGQLPEAQRARLAQVTQEYIETQAFSAERPESQLNLAAVYADLGRYTEAEQAYRRALRQQPRFVPAYVNFAQMLAGRQREQEAENLLRRGLGINPKNATLAHALGLSLVRQKKLDAALGFLQKAAEQAPEQSHYAYVYAVALQSAGQLDQALSVLERALLLQPGDSNVLFALATFNRDAGRIGAARSYARRLQRQTPGNPSVQRLIQQLDRSNGG